MYDLSRLRGVAAAAIVVVGGLACLSALALATSSGRPDWLPRTDSTMEEGQEKVVGGRVAGVIAGLRSGDLPGSLDLGVLLGPSALGMGINPTDLAAQAGPTNPTHWLSLYANGTTTSNLHDLAQPLFASGLRFRLLVLAIHPGLLARSVEHLNDRRTINLNPFWRELAARHVVAAKDRLQEVTAVPLNWAFPNRTRISNFIRAQVTDLKWQAFQRLGMDPTALYPADRDPWHVKLLVADEATTAREAAAEGRVVAPANPDNEPAAEDVKGWTNPAAYDPDNDNARALVAVIREARELGIEVVITILPESTPIRASVPSESMRNLRAVLDRSFPGAVPLVIDFREALRDNEFHDRTHPNQVGRAIITRRLAEALRDRPPAHP